MDKTLIALSLIGGTLTVVGVFFVGSGAQAPLLLPTPEGVGTPTESVGAITFIFGGDVMLGRKVNFEMHQRNDFLFPFASITPVFAGADAVMVNLESPFYDTCPITNKETMKLCADSLSAQTFKDAGITLVSFANNHIADYGLRGIQQTRTLLASQGIGVINNASTTIIEIRGKKIGFVAYNLTGYNVMDADVRLQISDLRKHVDFLIASFHWGEEYTDQPSAYQIRVGHLAVDAGADIVIGHHPHWIQPVEQYGGKYIFYSLGNLIFDQMWSEKTRVGVLVKVAIMKDNSASFEILPIKIFDWAQPRLLEGTEKQQTIDFMEKTIVPPQGISAIGRPAFGGEPFTFVPSEGIEPPLKG